MDHPQRRREDNMLFKLGKLASVITATAVVLGALALVGSTVFAKKDINDADHRVFTDKIQGVEKDQVRVIQKLDDMDRTLQEIKDAVKR